MILTCTSTLNNVLSTNTLALLVKYQCDMNYNYLKYGHLHCFHCVNRLIYHDYMHCKSEVYMCKIKISPNMKFVCKK